MILNITVWLNTTIKCDIYIRKATAEAAAVTETDNRDQALLIMASRIGLLSATAKEISRLDGDTSASSKFLVPPDVRPGIDSQ